jgi:hypothetical protein
MTTEVKPSPELLKLCPMWIPFLLKKHKRSQYKKGEVLDIMDTKTCMVGEAWGFTSFYTNCEICRLIACDLDNISEHNKSDNILPKQVAKMIRKGNTFATHYFKKHGESK